MKPITTSVFTFSDLIEGGFLYVDKTAAIYDLIRQAKGQYFLSRPRRFGKSLLVSTLKAVFQGRRELFEGLALSRADYDWKAHPVIHLDLGSSAAQTPGELEKTLLREIRYNAEQSGISIMETDAASAFLELIRLLVARDGKVVILVDEYDKPLLGHLGEPEVAGFQRVLKQFYSVIKTTEPLQRFALMTGVSKFAKVSIFSDLNNLTDLTMDPRTATLLGYTQEELECAFPDYIERLAGTLGKSKAETLEKLRTWYNGYRFELHAPTVYNPVSVMKCLDTQRISNFWFETGTPAFLIDLLRRTPLDLDDLSMPESAFSTYDPLDLHPLPLLVQTGYLTIKGGEFVGDALYYRLAYPNLEIENAFSYWLVRDLSRLQDPELSGALRKMVRAIQAGDVAEMLGHIRVFFANIPYDLAVNREQYYQTVFFTLFKLVGVHIEAEVRTNIGRIDAVVKTAAGVFVFEFKLNGTADEALAQIRERRYYEPYLDAGRPVTLVGVEFSRTARNIGEHRIEPLDATIPPAADRVHESDSDFTAVAADASPDAREIARRLRDRGIDPAIIAEVTGWGSV